MKTKQLIKSTLLSTLLLSSFFYLAVASGQDKKQDKEEDKVEEKLKTEKAIIVSSNELFEKYQSNEVAADEKFKGKVIQVNGKILDISKNIIDEDEIIVKLNGLIDNEFDMLGVNFYFDKKHSSEVATLSKGVEITIKGICKGKTIVVSVEGCSLVK